MSDNKKNPWYVGGLHFECQECGNCCAGPEEGYIWITKHEIEMLAKYLGMTVEQLRQKYLRRYGLRSSIIEESKSKDCIFLTNINGSRGCAVYSVRPNQCRTWPFWPANLENCDQWNEAGLRCPGINRGRLYSAEEIDALRKQRKWWSDEDC